MNPTSPVLLAFRRLPIVGLLCAAAVGLVLAGGPADPPPEPARTQLLRWVDQGHDWLLVADRVDDQVSVYDATDGRPLGVLGRDDGLGDVHSIALEGRWLLVLGKDEPKVVRLPDLRAEPLRLAAR